MHLDYETISKAQIGQKIADDWAFYNNEFDGYEGVLTPGFFSIKKKNNSSYGSSTGWKFHIGLDISDMKDDGYSANMAKGWEIAYEVLATHGVPAFKVMSPESLRYIAAGVDNQLIPQINKQITIYADPYIKPSEWQEIFEEITSAYQKEEVRCIDKDELLRKIKQGYQLTNEQPNNYELENKIHRSERRIPGSDFITYCHEDAQYKPATNTEDYLSGAQSDPYSVIKLENTGIANKIK